MAPVTNARVIFSKVPEGIPQPGTTTCDTSETIDIENVPLQGGFLVKTLVVSIDPYLRNLMVAPGTKSLLPTYTLGQPLMSYGVGVVVRSDCRDMKAGDHVYGTLPHQQYFVQKDLADLRVLDNTHRLPWSTFVGAAGMPGQTAFYGWKEFSHATRGETVFVSGAAGAVGSFIIQLAKMDGLKVIASAGSDEKVEFVKQLGADVAFNYKEVDTAKVLAENGPINIYWDNVGGPTLDAALEAATQHARFIECGQISGYNTGGAPVKNLMNVVTKCISMNGFMVTSLEKKYVEEFYRVVPEQIAKGKIRHREQVFEGLQNVEEVLRRVLKGETQGKAVVQVATK
ncbi:alcohol dehydrogenase [Pluteus cervinus]|uniref:Alcohol dehydrogenase n=1 Tax=Pluteus cervinus TaxID=181527 RepID=A0ACD3AIY3_9AGAR|nr:alcohol dehydrogenase [Pluteus cervinus]